MTLILGLDTLALRTLISSHRFDFAHLDHSMPYEPPFTLNDRLIDLVSQISEALGRWQLDGSEPSPQLRRENRIRSIQASLAIEANTLSVDQVTAVVDGKSVWGPPREIKEVQNAVKAYAALDSLQPHSVSDFLKAHRFMMKGLVEGAGAFRQGGVGIYQGEQLVHMAPPAQKVPFLIQDLMDWCQHATLHPLFLAAVMHYEIEFIHPFSDGNGRIGRFWQTLVLSQWKPQLAYLPVETIVKDRQKDYYAALGEADRLANAHPFVEFSLSALLTCLNSPPFTDQVTDQATDQVKRLLSQIKPGEKLTAAELQARLGLKHRPTFQQNYLRPALAVGMLCLTQPDSPRSPTQRYYRPLR
jgi:Fic family protein